MTFTKADLAEHLLTELGISRAIIKDIVDQTFEIIRQALEQGEEVKLSRFGKFKLRDKSSRPGRNPKTGEQKEIAKRRVVTFTAAQTLKSQVAALQEHQKTS